PDRLCQQFAVVAPKPPSPGASGAFPTVLGISPEIGPPLAAAAGVESVWFAPVIVLSTCQESPSSGVIPWTCAELVAGTARPPRGARPSRRRFMFSSNRFACRRLLRCTTQRG